MSTTQHDQNLADRLTPVSQRDQNLAQWEAIRASRFPHITDPAIQHELHIAFMAGFSCGMTWTRELYSRRSDGLKNESLPA